jgi:hypothetical protein
MDEGPTWLRIEQSECRAWGQRGVGDNEDGNDKVGTMTKTVTAMRTEDWGNNGDGDGDDEDRGNNEDGDHNEDGGYDKNADDAGREDWGNNGDRDNEDGGQQ